MSQRAWNFIFGGIAGLLAAIAAWFASDALGASNDLRIVMAAIALFGVWRLTV